MIKAKFAEQQNAVKIITNGNNVSVFICQNEVEVNDTFDYEDIPIIFYEYDYNEFTVSKDSINLDDIKNNPQDYLNYDPTASEPTESERLEALESAMQDLILTTLMGGGE